MAFNKKQVESFFQRAGFDPEKGRETMDALRARFNKIKRQLEEAEGSQYQPTDEIHLVTIVMCEEIQMRAFADIIENGVTVFVDAAKTVKQKSHSISTFFQMGRIINDTSKKLGLSALDRKELNLQMPVNDGMNDGE